MRFLARIFAVVLVVAGFGPAARGTIIYPDFFENYDSNDVDKAIYIELSNRIGNDIAVEVPCSRVVVDATKSILIKILYERDKEIQSDLKKDIQQNILKLQAGQPQSYAIQKAFDSIYNKYAKNKFDEFKRTSKYKELANFYLNENNTCK